MRMGVLYQRAETYHKKRAITATHDHRPIPPGSLIAYARAPASQFAGHPVRQLPRGAWSLL
jgi:hypothetical protein